jgi:parallel beta-helix repeat protein
VEQFNPLGPTPGPHEGWFRFMGLTLERLVRFLRGLKRSGDTFVFDLPLQAQAFVSRRYVTHPDNGCVADNATDNSAAIAALASGHYFVPTGTYKFTTAGTISVPAGVTLEFERGAIFDVGTSTTLIVAGDLVAGAHQIFRHTVGTSASAVRFTGPGRTVRASWWGVVGNGITDCTFAMQAALSARITASDSHVVLVDVAGVIVSDTLSYCDGQRIRGLGAALTTLKRKANFSGAAAFLKNVDEATLAEGVEIAYLTIDGNRANVSGASSGDGNAMGIRAAGVSNMSIHHCVIKDCWTDGIYIGKGTATTANVHVSECVVTNCRRNNVSVVHCAGWSVTRCALTAATGTAPESGIDIEALTGETVTDGEVSNCTVSGNDSVGIAVYFGTGGTMERIRVLNNSCSGNGLHGILIGASTGVSTAGRVLVSGNDCASNLGAGIAIVATSTTNLDYNQVTGNRCRSNGTYGIHVEHSAWNVLANNTCSSNTLSGIILTSDTSEGNLVTGNLCSLNGGRGIYLFSVSRHNAVRANTCVRNQEHGIYATNASSDTLIVGNTSSENSQLADATYDGIRLNTNCDRCLIVGNVTRRGALANKQGYGLNINTSDCDSTIVGQNDFYDGGSTAFARDAGTNTLVQVQEGLTADAGDAAYTHTPWSNAANVLYATAITADRIVTFQNAGALKGMRGTVVRRSTATGAFNVLVKDNAGVNTLATLAVGQRCDVVFNGSAWVLAGRGGVYAAAQSAYTQTYGTADRTIAGRTSALLTDSVGGTTGTTLAAIPDPADTPLTVDALRDDLVANVLPALRNAVSSLIAQANKERADGLDTVEGLNALLDDIQATNLIA